LFGQKLFRSTYNLDQCFDTSTTPSNSTAISATCQPGGATYNDISNAKNLANNDGIVYELQLGTGTGFDQQAASNGSFEHLAELMMQNLPITNFEAWNEPDNNTFSSPSQYVTTALEPAWNAKNTVAPNDKIIGISNENYSISNYNQYVNAGALNYLNIVGLHSYTGWSQSFEEQGNVIPTLYDTTSEQGQLQQLQAYLATKGYSGSIYDTESGFFSNEFAPDPDPYDLFEQGDKLVRKMILEQSIGMNWLANFYNSGTYPINGLGYFGLLGGRSNQLTPGGLAALNYQANLGGRSFVSWLPTGIPHTYAAKYGPSGSNNNDVVAIWSDDYSVNAIPTLSNSANMSITSEYGVSSTLTNGQPLGLSGQVQYISVPSGTTLSIASQESYSTNLALSSSYGGSATATASSSICGNATTDPQILLRSITDSQGNNFTCNNGSPVSWSPTNSDSNPTLTVNLGSPKSIDRVFTSTEGISSSRPGVRGFIVSVDPVCSGGSFTQVGQVANQYYSRNALISFSAQTVCKIQFSNITDNLTGAAAGLPPIQWQIDNLTSLDGYAPFYDVEVYGPGSSGGGTNPTPPSVPTGLQATSATDSSISLSWTASSDSSGPGIGGYYIFRNGNLVKTSTDTGTTYTDTGLSPSTSYAYKVEAYDTNNLASSASTTLNTSTTADNTPPTAPTGLTAGIITSSSIALTWNASTDNVSVSGYYVYVNGTKEGPYSTTSASLSSLNSSTQYTIYVVAFDPSNNISSHSQSISPTTLANTPPPTCTPDFANKGTSGIQDAEIMFAHWKLSPATCSDGDINNDGIVNIQDAQILFSVQYWNKSP
jgi:chitodextrinase